MTWRTRLKDSAIGLLIAAALVGAFFAAVRGVFSPWALGLMGGSIVLYVLLLAWDRRLEQQSSTLRRTIHGFNAILMSGLLLVVQRSHGALCSDEEGNHLEGTVILGLEGRPC